MSVSIVFAAGCSLMRGSSWKRFITFSPNSLYSQPDTTITFTHVFDCADVIPCVWISWKEFAIVVAL
ncbi:hypothetical protein CEXT_660651, partial [Caerostris extrusa]